MAQQPAKTHTPMKAHNTPDNQMTFETINAHLIDRQTNLFDIHLLYVPISNTTASNNWHIIERERRARMTRQEKIITPTQHARRPYP